MKAEPDHHLRHEQAAIVAAPNRANGTSSKRLETGHGTVPIAVPRHRAAARRRPRPPPYAAL